MPRRLALIARSFAFVCALEMLAAAGAYGQTVTVSPSSLTYGIFRLNTSSVSKTVIVANGQGVPLTISSIASTNADFIVSSNCPIAPNTVAPGAACSISVRFMPVAAGARAGMIAIVNNSAGNPLTVSMSGTGVYPLLLSTNSLTFSGLAKGRISAGQSIAVTSNQASALRITNIASSAPDFVPSWDCPISPSTLAGGGGCTVLVKFNPKGIGTRNGTLTIAYNAGGSPQVVALGGTGLYPALVSIAVTPDTNSLPLGGTVQLFATGTYTDGSVQSLTSSAIWSSSAPSVAGVNAGLVSSLGQGSAVITASHNVVSGSAALTVMPPALVSLTVAPNSASLAPGDTQQFTATGVYADGSTLDLTNTALWTSSADLVATVNQGLVKGVGGGSAAITASLESFTASAAITVQGAAASPLTITPDSLALDVGASLPITATTIQAGGVMVDVTSLVSWNSANPAVANVTPDGVVQALGAGTTTLTASLGPVSASVIVSASLHEVTPPFFGVHFRASGAQVTVPYGRCRIWGASGAYWADIEPSPGVYNFAALDQVLAAAKQAGVDDGCIFTFGYFPQWASGNPTDDTCEMLTSTTGSCWPPLDLNFDGSGTDQTVVDAITAIAGHVNDPGYLQTHAHIKYWEPFNEPYRSSTISGTVCTTSHRCSFNGSYAQLVRIAEDMRCVIKGEGSVDGQPCTRTPIDTSAAILTPSGNTYFDVNGRRVVGNFLACNDAPRAGSGCTTGSRGSAAVDVVNFHCYVWSGNPDDVVSYVRAARTLLGDADLQKPFFCDEGGWATNSTFPDPDLQAGFIARWFIDLFSERVTTAMWYAWDDQFWGTLWARQNYNGCTDANGCLTKAGGAYTEVNRWLSGASLEPCQVTGTVTECQLTRPDGFSGLLVWDNSTLTTCIGQPHPEVCGGTAHNVAPQYTVKTTLDGSVQPANSVEYIGAKPILLSNF